MEKRQTVELLLSNGIRIPSWIKNLKGVVIQRKRIRGRRIRTIKFPRALAEFGQKGGVWLSLIPFQNSFRHFKNTLQIRNGRGSVIDSNMFLCQRCFELSGSVSVWKPLSASPSRVEYTFRCKNKKCPAEWRRVM